MPPRTNKPKADNLVALARERFGDLSAAETNLLEAVPKGEFAVCGSNDNWDDPANDPAKDGEWNADREIRADLIRWLCVDGASRERMDPKGIQAFGAKVVGELDLSSVAVPFGLALRRCRLMEDAKLYATDLLNVDLQGTWVRSFKADGISVKGSVFLRNGFRAEDEVRLVGAQIGGTLDCDSSVFTNPSNAALSADRINVKGGVFLCNGFRAEGEVRLLGAQVGGDLVCVNGVFINPSKDALNADGISVKGSVFLCDGFRVEGEVRLVSAQIGGALECDTSVFTNPSGVALNADRINVKGGVFLRKGVRVGGEVRLVGAQIDGTLECDTSVFTNPSGVALNADGISVKGDVFLRHRFRAEGEVRLLGAQVGGNLECDNSVFTNPSKDALSADHISVKGSVFLRNGFRAEGEVRLLGAEVGGNLECDKSEFRNPTGLALNAEGTSVKGSVFLRNGFRAEGEVGLVRAQVGGSFRWLRVADPEKTRIDLRNASVGALADDIENWPPVGKLSLDGFTYVRFAGAEKDARKRLEWLGREDSFAPQPYRQLAKVLREDGDNAGARLVLFEMERLRRQKEDRGRLARFWSGMLRLTIGFGYYPGISLLWLLGLTFLSMVLTWGSFAVGGIAPSDKDAYAPFKQSSQLPLHYERFHASVYALENSFPLVKLGQAERWQPDPNPEWQCSPKKNFLRPFCGVLSPGFLRWFRWCQICLGWFFTTMFVAGVTGIVRKD